MALKRWKRRMFVALVAACVTLLSTRVAAEPASSAPPGHEPTHITVSVTVRDDAGHELKLPPSYCLDEVAWDHLDLEVTKLQEDRTRLRAENKSFRESGSWGWGTISLVAGALLTGAAGVWYLDHR